MLTNIMNMPVKTTSSPCEDDPISRIGLSLIIVTRPFTIWVSSYIKCKYLEISVSMSSLFMKLKSSLTIMVFCFIIRTCGKYWVQNNLKKKKWGSFFTISLGSGCTPWRFSTLGISCSVFLQSSMRILVTLSWICSHSKPVNMISNNFSTP